MRHLMYLLKLSNILDALSSAKVLRGTSGNAGLKASSCPLNKSLRILKEKRNKLKKKEINIKNLTDRFYNVWFS